MISTQKTIDEFRNFSSEEKEQWENSLYMYLLYICGGDFKSFNDIEALNKACQIEKSSSA